MDTLPLLATVVGTVVTMSTTILGGTKWMLQRVEQRSDRRFDQVDKRFEQVDKRFEQVDKRFEQVDKRFEEVDKRFEQVDQQLRSVVDSVTELKIAVARIEGPHPPFLIVRG